MHESEILGNVWDGIKWQVLTECSNPYNLLNKRKQRHFKLIQWPRKKQILKKTIPAKGYTPKKIVAKAIN